MISIRSLVKNYGNIVALDHLNLDIEAGKIFGFLGTNGAGKTTTMKIITYMKHPTEGGVYIDNQIVNSKTAPVLRQKIGYLQEDPPIYEWLTGREFLFFVGKIFKVPDTKLDEQVNYYINLFKLESMEDYLIKDYSHGMKHKIALAASLLHEPDILLLDEPVTGLDPEGIRTLKNILTEYRNKNRCVVLCTHILEIAENLCDEFGILHKGHLLFKGTLKELQNYLSMPEGGLEEMFLKLTQKNETIQINNSGIVLP
ncbi:MAG: ABC transporter ATP-binding protein [bacterium]|nr:ABC transporter ATP-binding protein [bacterium]